MLFLLAFSVLVVATACYGLPATLHILMASPPGLSLDAEHEQGKAKLNDSTVHATRDGPEEEPKANREQVLDELKELVRQALSRAASVLKVNPVEEKEVKHGQAESHLAAREKEALHTAEEGKRPEKEEENRRREAEESSAKQQEQREKKEQEEREEHAKQDEQAKQKKEERERREHQKEQGTQKKESEERAEEKKQREKEKEKEEEKEKEKEKREQEDKEEKEKDEKANEGQADTCLIETGVEYMTSALALEMKHVSSLGACRSKCFRFQTCGAWVWRKPHDKLNKSGLCVLKESNRSGSPRKTPSPGVISGLHPGLHCRALERRPVAPEVRLPTPPKPGDGPVRSQDGICLEGLGKPKGGKPVEIRMKRCTVPWAKGPPTQHWTFDPASGQLKNYQGQCLHAPHPMVDGSEVHLEWCNGAKNQQWAYDDESGQIVNWHGICVAAPQRRIHGSKVQMQRCDLGVTGQRWLLGVPFTKDRWYYDSGAWDKNYTPGSLYCFALMQPHGPELLLMQMQQRERSSIFRCDEAAVYSNMSMEIGPGVHTVLVDSNLTCIKGGEFGTALNLDIFVQVWKAVISDGHFSHHEWTIKVDPDTVFFPARLSRILKAHPMDNGEAVYLNNCKFGFHGPIEVFSSAAVKTWVEGVGQCIDHFTKLCSGDCKWGEDMFIDQCMMRVLKVRRDNEFRLLTEEHCDPAPDWGSCENDVAVSFHPFKSVPAYRMCRETAEAAAA